MQHTLAWHADTAAAVLTATGDLGGSPDTQAAFAAALDELIAMHDAHAPAAVVIDMTGAGFLESSALNALVLAHRRTGQPLRVRLGANQNFIRRVITVAGLDQVLRTELAGQ